MGAVSAARIMETCFWAFVIIGLVAALGFAQTQPSQYEAAVLIGFAVTLFGVRAFIGDGGSRITALGLFNLSTAIFVGFGAIYAGWTQDPRVPATYLGMAALGAFVPQVVVTLISWGRAQRVEVRFPEVKASRWITCWGAVGLAAAAAVKLGGAPEALGPYIESAAFTSITVLTVGLYWRPNARILSWATALVGALALVYAEVFHIGSGRLRIVALICAIGVIMTARFQRKILKWGTIAAIGPALYWLAQDRKDLQESLRAGASAGRTGLESMLEPIIVFGRLIEAHVEAGFHLSYGVNLLSYPFALLPATWFPNAPQALGYELVKITAPAKYGTGYSVVATSSGEAYYNFGVIGLALIIPVLIVLLRLLDGATVRAMSAESPGLYALLWIVFWTMLAGGISDLTWSGQHTFLTRASTRLPLLGLLTMLAWFHVRLNQKKVKPVRRIPLVQTNR